MIIIRNFPFFNIVLLSNISDFHLISMIIFSNLVYCSGSEFEGSASGLSIPDSICTDRALSVISVKSLLSNPEKVASEISHMIGHNIGLEHDTAGMSDHT